MSEPYNPLDKRNIGKSIAEAMLASEALTFPLRPFSGAGIYALYYLGGFDVYAPIAKTNNYEALTTPIYVGKAVPSGSRKGGVIGGSTGRPLFSRLVEHEESIAQAKNLKIEDFRVRYLTVDDIFIPLGESLLIEMFLPLWNQRLDGFGNHDPGANRRQSKRSAWDILHPGRIWAENLQPGLKTAAELQDDVRAFLATPKGEKVIIKVPKTKK